MTQEAIAVSTTPPLPGLQMVQQINAALQTIASNFAGPNDPASLAGPLMTWADTESMPNMLRRRNEANTAWVTLGPLFDFHYTRGNALGTVSQSGGVPTGALWQTISNANGTVYRNAQGLQIAFVTSGIVLRATTAYGSIFVSGLRSYSFGAPFSSLPAVVDASKRIVSGQTFYDRGWGAIENVSETGVDQAVYSPVNGGGMFPGFIAVGRWFQA